MRIVGNNRADDAADDQRADPVPAVHAAVIAAMVMTRRRGGVMPLDDGTAVTDGTAFVHHGARLVVRTPAVHHGTAAMDGAAFVRHGLCLVVRTPAVHHGTAVTDGTAFVRHGLCFMSRSGFMHGLCPVSRCAFMNGRSCMVAGTLPLHRGFHLMAGGAFVRFLPDLLGLRRGPAAAVMTGCRCLGHTH